jgi:hypothetical protein
MARSQDGGDLDIEFVFDDASPDDGEDVLSAGAPRVLPGVLERVGLRMHPVRAWSRLRPRWRPTIATASAGVLLVAAAVAVQTNRSPHRAAVPPRPSTSVPAGPGVVPSLAYTSGPPGAPPPGEGYPLQLPPGSPLDVAISSTSLYVLLDTELLMVDAYSGDIVRAAAVDAGPSSRLVLDDADAAIWVVSDESAQGVVRRFDTATLSEDRAVTMPATIYDAAVLDGRLFIATSTGIDEFAPGATSWTPVTATNPPAEVVLADPLDDTVYALTSGPNGRLITLSPDGDSIVVGPVLGISQPSLALAGNELWVGGVGPSGAVRQIDPQTMAPASKKITVASSIGTGAQVEAGANDLWVYSPAASRLFCVDRQTGQELQHWNELSGPVTAGGSGPYAIGRGQVLPLVLRGACQG